MEAAVLSDPSLDEQARVLATLVSAFRRGPVERWLYPDDQQFEHHFPCFLAAFGGSASNSAERVPDGQKITGVLMDTVAPAKHADTLAALEQMGAAHPTDAHWYLPWFGVNAAGQGQGGGSRLMTARLDVVDAVER